MAFVDELFPYFPMKHGISKRIIDPVSVVSNGNHEYRIKRQSWERYEWTLPTQTMTDAQKEEIRGFLLRYGNSSLDSFKFADPDFERWPDYTMFTYNSSNYWNVVLPYDRNDVSVAGTHPIFHNNYTNIPLRSNGVDVTQKPITILNGVPVVDMTGYVSGPSDVITINNQSGLQGPLFAVRLGSTLSYALDALDTNNRTLGVSHQSIKLIEVFEY